LSYDVLEDFQIQFFGRPARRRVAVDFGLRRQHKTFKVTPECASVNVVSIFSAKTL
jgi:hypothetical protein